MPAPRPAHRTAPGFTHHSAYPRPWTCKRSCHPWPLLRVGIGPASEPTPGSGAAAAPAACANRRPQSHPTPRAARQPLVVCRSRCGSSSTILFTPCACKRSISRCAAMASSSNVVSGSGLEDAGFCAVQARRPMGCPPAPAPRTAAPGALEVGRARPLALNTGSCIKALEPASPLSNSLVTQSERIQATVFISAASAAPAAPARLKRERARQRIPRMELEHLGTGCLGQRLECGRHARKTGGIDRHSHRRTVPASSCRSWAGVPGAVMVVDVQQGSACRAVRPRADRHRTTTNPPPAEPTQRYENGFSRIQA